MEAVGSNHVDVDFTLFSGAGFVIEEYATMSLIPMSLDDGVSLCIFEQYTEQYRSYGKFSIKASIFET